MIGAFCSLGTISLHTCADSSELSVIGATGVGAGARCADAIGAPIAITSAAQLPVIAMPRFQVEIRMRAPRVREPGCPPGTRTLIDFASDGAGAGLQQACDAGMSL
ncbi:hypothetical protein [Saccharopolyspora sp. NPDC002376]